MSYFKLLYRREKLLGSDACEALEQAAGEAKLPIAVSKYQVLDALLDIASIVEDGSKVDLGAAKASRRKDFWQILETSKVFQAGYEQYAEKRGVPVIPVTLYFFKHVFDSNENLTHVLENMTDVVLTQSLPKRPSDIQVKDGNGDPYSVPSGKIAGVIIFPSNYVCGLLHRWEERRIAVANGQMASTLDGLQRVKPGSLRLAHARVAAGKLGNSARLSLPPFKKKG